jgi:Mycothiol maleylpyruvate isomerase N-terminal domain
MPLNDPVRIVDERSRGCGHTVGVDGGASKQTLFEEEDRAWNELHELVDSLPEDKAAEPGYFEEGWSAKDLVAHIGSWLAEAGVVLEQIQFGTYQAGEVDVDAMNQAFYEAMHDVPFSVVRAQGVAARNRMLRAWRSLPEDSSEADRWIRKAGPDHYAEHLPRLREWVSELAA